MISRLISLPVISFLVFLGSCMGEDGTVLRYGSQAGVVRLDAGKQIYLRNGMILETGQLDTLAVEDGDCCLVDFQLNKDTQTDTLQGIWHPDWLTYRPVPKWTQVNRTEPDTLPRADEHFLNFSIQKGGFVSNHLFLYMEYSSHYQTQVDSFRLSFLPDEGLVLAPDSIREVYQLYLRSFGRIEPKDSVTKSTVLPFAFDITAFLDAAAAKSDLPLDTLHFQVVYPDRFVGDSTRFSWKTSDVYSLPASLF